MSKPKKPTMKELAQLVLVQGQQRGQLNAVLQMYMEWKGELVMFNTHLAEKQKEMGNAKNDKPKAKE